MTHPLLPGLLRLLRPQLEDGMYLECEHGYGWFRDTPDGRWLEAYDHDGNSLGNLNVQECREKLGRILSATSPDRRGLAGAVVIRGVGS